MDGAIGRALVVTATLLSLSRGVLCQEDAEEPEAVFRRVFAEEMEPTERVSELERLVKEHRQSRWADDALWVLGEAARQQKCTERAVYYWQFLMAFRPDVELEEFTRSLPLYGASRLPQVYLHLEAAGLTYVRREGVAAEPNGLFVNARPFNPVPMVVWQELGRALAQLGKLELAVKAYGRALAAAPEGSHWVGTYQAATERLERKLAAAPDGEAPESGPPTEAPCPALDVTPGGRPAEESGDDAPPPAEQTPPEDAAGD
jgi:tetratricopeptide (TPR) repeat protein